MKTTDTAALLKAIDGLGARRSEDVMESLAERKKKELEFHDRDRDPGGNHQPGSDTYEKFYGNRKYYRATRRSSEYVSDWIARESKGKVFLDYACGNGSQAILAAKSGAELSVGFDISGVSVENARVSAAAEGVTERTRFFQADAEDTGLPAAAFDTVICSGMLHHLDLSYAIPELRRIVKPGGKVLAVEALGYNPAIKLYRRLTPDMRTDWEKAHILDLADVEFISRFFDVDQIRYWHIVGYVAGRFPWLFRVLDPADRVLERIPLVQRMAWIFTFTLRRGQDD
jgi:SAM-dependent methyltransferase